MKKKQQDTAEVKRLTVPEGYDGPMLDIRDLRVIYKTDLETVEAINGISLRIGKGKTFGLVGETGAGKTTTALSILRLLPHNTGRILNGEILFNGVNLLDEDEEVMRAVRGNLISMVFQDPMSSLNPLIPVGKHVAEMIHVHHPEMKRDELQAATLELFREVRIPEAEKRLISYPHVFSGGMRQRVMIAMALACSPKLIIADEPTTALDVTIQAQILDLLRNLKDQINSSIMFITHDLGVIAEMADYVVVMYAGRIVEQGTAEEIFSHPAHPYTIGLMASKPVVGRQVDKLYSIPGKVPNPINMPNYCYFKDRCEMCVNGCEGDYPCEVSISPTHKVSCYRYYDGKRPDLEEVVEEELAEGKENGKEGE